MDTFLSMLGFTFNPPPPPPPMEDKPMELETFSLYYKDNSSPHIRGQTMEFMNLPPELQTKILLYLPVDSIKQARLVCSSWCDLIDSSREFSLIVNDRKYDYTACTFPPWKITSCLIKNLHQHQDINFLPYPSTLRRLLIWGTISRPNFHLLMNQLCNIEELDLACDFFTSHKDFWTVDGVQKKINLDNVKKLTMFSSFNIMNHRDNLFGFFMQSMPNLTKLKITMEDPGYNRNALVISAEEVTIAIGLAQFIAQQKTLKVLQISITPAVYSDEEWLTDAVRRVHEAPNYAVNLSRVKLQICRLHVSPLYITLLRPLLAAQTDLKDFRIQSQFIEGVPILYQNLEDSLRFSVKTLGSIHLEYISRFPLHPMTIVNFELFSQAKHLKRLVLKRWWGFSMGINGMAKITNLDRIPETIEHLTIEGFICSSSELITIAESEYMKLREVGLIHVGLYGDEVGINGKVAKAFSSIENLSSLSMGPLKNMIADREDPEYQELRERFKDDYFRSGKTVNIDFVQYRKKLELKRKKEAQAEERRRMLCSCFHGK